MCVHVYVKADASMYSGMEAKKRYLLFSIVPCLILEAGHLTKSELANFQLLYWSSTSPNDVPVSAIPYLPALRLQPQKTKMNFMAEKWLSG